MLALSLLAVACSHKEPSVAPPSAAASAPAEGSTLTAKSDDGVTIRYHVYGSGEPALIFIHGWACDATYWDSQLDYFNTRYAVVTLDLAGHGESGTARAAWTMSAFADDVTAVAERIPAEQLVLVGHSMGGTVALEAARRLRGRVIGIVGVDTFGNIGLPPATPAELEQRLEPFRQDFRTQMRDYVTKRFFTPRSDPTLVRRIADDMASQPPGIAIGVMIGMNDMNYAAALGDLDVPIVAINSDRLPTDVERIRLHAPTFRLKLVPGTGHFVMLEDPARFNRALDETVQELVAEAAPSVQSQ